MATELSQTASELRLENDNQRNCQENRKASHQPTDHHQIEHSGDECQGQEDNGETGQHFRSARPAKIKIAVINADTEQDDLKNAAPAFEPELKKFLKHHRI